MSTVTEPTSVSPTQPQAAAENTTAESIAVAATSPEPSAPAVAVPDTHESTETPTVTLEPSPEPTATHVAMPTTASELPAAPVVTPTPTPEPSQTPETAVTTTTTIPKPVPTTVAPPEPTSYSEKENQPEDKEPQNALTERFTEYEWKAVKELRDRLPEIFAKAYEKPEAKTTPIMLWGVPIDPSHVKDARVSVVLVKFLRARNLSVRDAEQMLVATLRWREEFKVEKAVQEEYPKEIFGQLGRVYGKDKEGRPVVYNLYGANKDSKAVFGDVPRFLRWRVALMEKSISYLDFETVDQTVQIHDYEGMSLTQRDANTKNAASEATSIFQDHYPEFLSRKFFVNVPIIFTWLFWAFKPLLSAATMAKMTVVGTGHRTISKALFPIIDKKELPKRYGGEAAGF